MMTKRILILSCVLLVFPLQAAMADDGGHCVVQPNEAAVDLCVHMRLVTPPEKHPGRTELGPSLFSKLGGLASSWRHGTVGRWITENPPMRAKHRDTAWSCSGPSGPARNSFLRPSV
jgi:hypothetical protein